MHVRHSYKCLKEDGTCLTLSTVSISTALALCYMDSVVNDALVIAKLFSFCLFIIIAFVAFLFFILVWFPVFNFV